MIKLIIPIVNNPTQIEIIIIVSLFILQIFSTNLILNFYIYINSI